MDETHDPYADGQVRWLRDDGTHSVIESHTDIEVNTIPGAGRGLVALAPLKMGTVIVAVRVYAAGRDTYQMLEGMFNRRDAGGEDSAAYYEARARHLSMGRDLQESCHTIDMARWEPYGVDEHTVKTMLNRIDANAFKMKKAQWGVFVETALMNHSCRPNVKKEVNRRNELW